MSLSPLAIRQRRREYEEELFRPRPRPRAFIELYDEEEEASVDEDENLKEPVDVVDPPFEPVPDPRFLDDEDLDKEVVYIKNPVPFIRSCKALTAMEKLRKYDFDKFPVRRYDKRKPPAAPLKCAQHCTVHGMLSVKSLSAGPWHFCPLRHNYGELYLSNPLPVKNRRLLKKLMALTAYRQTEYERKLLTCSCCSRLGFQHAKDSDIYYQEYLERVTWFGKRLHETPSQIRSRYSPRNFGNTLMEYDGTYNPSWLKDAGLPDTPQEFNFDYFSTETTMEFQTLVDPLNRFMIYEPSHLPRQLRSAPSPSLRRARSAAATRELRRAHIRTAPAESSSPSTPPQTPINDRLTGNAILMGYNYSATKAFANIKSRYMMPVKRMEKLKLKAKAPQMALDLPPSPLPALPDGAPYVPPTSPLVKSRDPPVFKQLKPKEARIEMGKTGTRLVEIRPRARGTSVKRPQLSPRLEFLSQPKPKPRKPSKRRRTRPAVAAQKSKTGSSTSAPRLLVKASASGVGKRKTRKRKLKPDKLYNANGQRKTPREILTAFGFASDVPVEDPADMYKRKDVSPVKREKKQLSKEAQKEKYRKSIMKMLETAARRSKKRKEQERMDNLERGLAAMAVQAAAAVTAAEEAASKKVA